jgi:hypothetical protein
MKEFVDFIELLWKKKEGLFFNGVSIPDVVIFEKGFF